VYGQSTWTPNFLSALHVTGGVRYNWEAKHDVGYHYISGVGNTNSFDLANVWTATTWKANVAYDLTPQNMVYIDRSNGFQSGGFGFGPSPEYEPETIQAWEIGSKNRFLDNHLQINASAWYYEVNDLDTAVTDVFTQPTASGTVAIPFIAITNAGNAIIRGQSLDLQWIIAANDRLTLYFEHLDAEFKNYDLTSRYVDDNYFNYCVGNPGGAPPCANPVNYFQGYSQSGNQSVPSFNYSHTPIGYSPKYAANATFDQLFHYFDATWDAQAIFHYVGSQLSGNQVAPFAYPYPSYWELPAYSTLDLNLTYQPNVEHWTVTGFMRNAADKAYKTAVAYSASNGLSGLAPSNPKVTYAYGTATYGPPRTFGVIFNFKF
jgi:iron complex outermembrane recepter protein